MHRVLLALTLTATLLAGCGTTTPAAEEPPVAISNVYVAAMDASMPMDGVYMTGAFMTLTNNTEVDLVLIGGTASFSPMVQVHEVVDGVMREKEGGLLVPAGGSARLEPGGSHLMFMGMPDKLLAGDEANFTLQFENGTTLDVAAPVKAMNAGQETYQATPSPSGSM